jgi:DNA-binding GntR family transcriptional regulator
LTVNTQVHTVWNAVLYVGARARVIALKDSPQSTRSADRVYDVIKSMVITFAIRPGERLNEVDLAKQLNVSRTPIREALNRLAIEGFLTTRLNKGFFVRSLDPHEAFSLYEFRSAIESAVVSIACERATADELQDIERFVHASKDTKDDVLAINLLKLDEEFHERLARATHNDEFVRTVRSINGRIHFIRWVDMQNARRTHTQNEHLQIVHALKRRDAKQASQLMRDHISRRLDQIVEVIRAGFAEIYMGNGLASHLEGIGASDSI